MDRQPSTQTNKSTVTKKIQTQLLTSTPKVKNISNLNCSVLLRRPSKISRGLSSRHSLHLLDILFVKSNQSYTTTCYCNTANHAANWTCETRCEAEKRQHQTYVAVGKETIQPSSLALLTFRYMPEHCCCCLCLARNLSNRLSSTEFQHTSGGG